MRDACPMADLAVVVHPEFAALKACDQDFKIPDVIVVGTEGRSAPASDAANSTRPLFLNETPHPV